MPGVDEVGAPTSRGQGLRSPVLLSRKRQRAKLCMALVAFATLGGCSGEPTSQPKQVVTIQVVHSPELRAYISQMRDAFASTAPTLGDGTSVQIELQSELGVPAAVRVANGEIKPDAWLAPSSALVNFANSQVRNLGARQVDCQQLFGSPVVLAVPTQYQDALKTDGQNFEWSRVFAAIEEGSAAGPRQVRFSHTPPKTSVSGLAVITQLLAFGSLPVERPLEQIQWSEQGAEAVRRFEHHVSEYSPSEGFLLERTAQSTAARVHVTLTTEQQVVVFNRNAGRDTPAVTALYPARAATWQDYTMCRSQADWMAPAHRDGAILFQKFLASETAQAALPAQGFRPSVLKRANPEVLGSSVGVNLSLPTGSAVVQHGEIVREILSHWERLLRPVAVTVVLDSSSSMEGAALTAAKDALREFLARIPPHVSVALVTFSNESRVVVPFTSDRAQSITALDTLIAQGGSAAYDGIKLGLDTLTAPTRADDRQVLLVITDGEGQTSEITKSALKEAFAQQLKQHDLSTIIMAVERDGANYDDLAEIAKVADGRYKELAVGELSPMVEDVLRSL